ncbi:unnamed protein product [Rotaria magnacalcarata]|uniref:Uncharacterized protein n=1 Tax=Rotaria magnacalcarata TaxID=392030 RepID=A0A819NIW3_9BILA|nr:unnamed protein product [Rotaria magnacalcarata]CAF3995681.1 unnamed protein product [Rotaria magnacalcarata]
MLFGGSHESSSEEDLSETDTTSSSASYITSKTATTDSWHDLKSDTDPQSEIIKQFEQINDTDVNELTLDEEDKAFIKSMDDRYFGGDSMEAESITIIEHEAPEVSSDDNNEQHTTNESVNLRASANFELATPVAGAIIQENTDSCNVRCISSNTDKEQTSTNSILINDEPTHIQNQTVTILSNTAANGVDHFNYKRFDTPFHQNTRNEPILNQQSTSLKRDDTISNDKSTSQPQNIGSETLLNSQQTPWINPFWNTNTNTTQNLTSIVDKLELTTSSIDTAKNSLPNHYESELTVSNKPHESSFHSSSNKSELENVLHHEDEHKSLPSNGAKSNQPQALTTGALEKSSNNNSNSNNENNALDITLLNNQQEESCDKPSGNDNQTSLSEFSKQTNHPTSTLNPVNEQSKTTASSLACHSTLQDQSLKEKEADTLIPIQETIRSTENPLVNPTKTSNDIYSKQDDKIYENPYWIDRNIDSIDHSTLESTPKFIAYSKDNILSAEKQIKNENKPSENPYWKDETPTVVPATTLEVKNNDNLHTTDTTSLIETSTKRKVNTFQNPYWKDETLDSNISKIPETESTNVIPVEATKTPTERLTKKEGTSFDNPYWKDRKTDSILPTTPEVKSEVNLPITVVSTEINTTPKVLDKPFENSYWKDNKPTLIPAATPEVPPKVNLSATNTITVADTSTKVLDKPFENPYWKDHKSVVIPSVTQEVQPKANFLVTNPVTDASAKVLDKPFENPYWKDNKSVVIRSVTQEVPSKANLPATNTIPVADTSTKVLDKPFENPYWKDNKPTLIPAATHEVPLKANLSATNTTGITDTSANALDKPFENPYWKDKSLVMVLAATPEVQPKANFLVTNPVADTSTKVLDKPFENPYWKDHKSVVIPSVTQEVQPKANFLVTNPVIDTSAKVLDKPFDNPYWKDRKTDSILPTTPEVKSEVNSPITVISTEIDTTPKVLDKPFENSYWKGSKSDVITTGMTQNGRTEIVVRDETKLVHCTSSTLEDEVFENLYAEYPKAEMDKSLLLQVNAVENPYRKDTKPVIVTVHKSEESTAEYMRRENNEQTTMIDLRSEEKPVENSIWNEKQTRDSKTSKPEGRLFENNNWDQCEPQETIAALSKPQTKPKEYSSVQDNKSQQMTSSKQGAESWQNPYWPSEPSKILSGESSTCQVVTIRKVQDTKNTKQTDRAIDDPYSKATSKRKESIKTIELLNAWIFDNVSPADHTIPPIPPFYKRVFPLRTPPASARSVVTITDKKLQTSKPPTQYSSSSVFYDSDNDTSTFTFDQEKIAHRHSLLPSANVSKNTIVSFVPSSLTNKNPVILSGKNDTAVAHQMNTTSSDLLRNKTALPLPVDNTIPSTTATTSSNIEWFKFPPDSLMDHESSINNLTPEEILEVQNVLRLLETNPNAIPIIQKPYGVQNFHAKNVELPNLQFSNLSTNNTIN